MEAVFTSSFLQLIRKNIQNKWDPNEFTISNLISKVFNSWHLCTEKINESYEMETRAVCLFWDSFLIQRKKCQCSWQSYLRSLCGCPYDPNDVTVLFTSFATFCLKGKFHFLTLPVLFRTNTQQYQCVPTPSFSPHYVLKQTLQHKHRQIEGKNGKQIG